MLIIILPSSYLSSAGTLTLAPGTRYLTSLEKLQQVEKRYLLTATKHLRRQYLVSISSKSVKGSAELQGWVGEELSTSKLEWRTEQIAEQNR